MSPSEACSSETGPRVSESSRYKSEALCLWEMDCSPNPFWMMSMDYGPPWKTLVGSGGRGEAATAGCRPSSSLG